MTLRRRAEAGLLLALVAVAACTAANPISGSSLAGPAGSPVSHPTSVPTGPGSAAAELAKLCVPANTTAGGKPPGEGPIPPAILAVEHQVEQARGLSYDHPVQVEEISASTMASRVTKSFQGEYPAALYARRTLAWRTIGVIPPTANLRAALLAFGSGQVVGYYDPATGALVVIADSDPTLTMSEHFVLAHELTHAIDDQHFGLSRLDPLIKHCEDEAFAAAVGAVEGNAQYVARQVILAHPSSAGLGDTGGGSRGRPTVREPIAAVVLHGRGTVHRRDRGRRGHEGGQPRPHRPARFHRADHPPERLSLGRAGTGGHP